MAQSGSKERLFIGSIETDTCEGSLLFGGGEESKLKFWGEMLCQGYLDSNDRLVVTRLNRLALNTRSKYIEELDKIGFLSVVGPSSANGWNIGPNGGWFEFRMDYRALWNKKQEYQFEDEFPRVRGNLKWEAGTSDSGQPTLTVKLEIEPFPQDSIWGPLPALKLAPTTITFYQRIDRTKRFASHALNNYFGVYSPPAACQNSPKNTNVRRLGIRFINLSTKSNNAVEPFCRQQLEGVREVWWQQAALGLVLWPNPLNGPNDQIIHITRDSGNLADMSLPQNQAQLPLTQYTVQGYIPIYLADRLPAADNGGKTNPWAGGSASYCILTVDLTNQGNGQNPYILSHELGHVVTVGHPNWPFQPGTRGSVMEPIVPNPCYNSGQNCGYLTTNLNSWVNSQGPPACFCPKNPSTPCGPGT